MAVSSIEPGDTGSLRASARSSGALQRLKRLEQDLAPQPLQEAARSFPRRGLPRRYGGGSVDRRCRRSSRSSSRCGGGGKSALTSLRSILGWIAPLLMPASRSKPLLAMTAKLVQGAP